MATQDPILNNLPAGTPWGDLTVSIPPFNISSWDLAMSPIPSWGDLVLIDPPEELDEDEMPGPNDALNYAFWEESHAAEPLEDPLAEENYLIAPILETAATIPAAEPLELLLLPPPALWGEAAADVSPSHREESSE